jgi:hypothetical protein
LHVAVVFGGTAHGVHDAPQLVVLTLLRHAAPHAWKPVLHANPQTPATHVAAPFAGTAQTVPHAPQ